MVSHKESCSRWDWHLLRVWGLLTTSCAFCTTAAGIRATAAGGSAQSGSQLMVLLLLPLRVPTAITRCRESGPQLMVLLRLPLRIPTAITRCREIQTPIEGAAFCTNTAATSCSSCSTGPASCSTTAAPSALRGRCSVPRSGPALRIVVEARLHHAGGTMVPHAALRR